MYSQIAAVRSLSSTMPTELDWMCCLLPEPGAATSIRRSWAASTSVPATSGRQGCHQPRVDRVAICVPPRSARCGCRRRGSASRGQLLHPVPLAHLGDTPKVDREPARAVHLNSLPPPPNVDAARPLGLAARMQKGTPGSGVLTP